jgi:hypothetical protein
VCGLHKVSFLVVAVISSVLLIIYVIYSDA